jgi:hypothetical protein
MGPFLDFCKKGCIDKENQIILLITKLHSKGLEKYIKDVGAKEKHYLMFFIRFWHSKCKYFILEMICSLALLFSLYLNMTFKIYSIDLNHSL